MSEIIKVLLVDDKEDYCESLAGIARKHNIHIIYKLDWETGFEVLQNERNIEFVILDGKGKLEEDQDKEKDNFAFTAIRDIDQYSNNINRDIPYCVNTGFIDNFEGLEGTVEIFEKGSSGRDNMFNYIQKEVLNSDYRTKRKLFPESFLVFDEGLLSGKHEYLLLDMIECFQKEDFRKKNLNIQRDILEACFLALNDPLSVLPPELFRTDGKPIMEHCTLFLEGRRIRGKNCSLDYEIPKPIPPAVRKVKDSSSEYSHLSDEEMIKHPFLSNFYLIFEILDWLRDFRDEHFAYLK